MSANYYEPHQVWCPRLTSPGNTCLCKRATIELADPRPELVERAVKRYRERIQTRGLGTRIRGVVGL